MRKLKIVILEEAIKDLEEIWFYTFATWSLEQADRYHLLITKEIDFLASKPESGKTVDYLRKGYRSSKVKSHYIFYKTTANAIEIVRILHENMDIPNRFND
ncbi:MAG: type II toxin-antitoxin system RelE/ParE family toxin [Chitinophagaceae bacterium]